MLAVNTVHIEPGTPVPVTIARIDEDGSLVAIAIGGGNVAEELLTLLKQEFHTEDQIQGLLDLGDICRFSWSTGQPEEEMDSDPEVIEDLDIATRSDELGMGDWCIIRRSHSFGLMQVEGIKAQRHSSYDGLLGHNVGEIIVHVNGEWKIAVSAPYAIGLAE